MFRFWLILLFIPLSVWGAQQKPIRFLTLKEMGQLSFEQRVKYLTELRTHIVALAKLETRFGTRFAGLDQPPPTYVNLLLGEELNASDSPSIPAVFQRGKGKDDQCIYAGHLQNYVKGSCNNPAPCKDNGKTGAKCNAALFGHDSCAIPTYKATDICEAQRIAKAKTIGTVKLQESLSRIFQIIRKKSNENETAADVAEKAKSIIQNNAEFLQNNASDPEVLALLTWLAAKNPTEFKAQFSTWEKDFFTDSTQFDNYLSKAVQHCNKPLPTAQKESGYTEVLKLISQNKTKKLFDDYVKNMDKSRLPSDFNTVKTWQQNILSNKDLSPPPANTYKGNKTPYPSVGLFVQPKECAIVQDRALKLKELVDKNREVLGLDLECQPAGYSSGIHGNTLNNHNYAMYCAACNAEQALSSFASESEINRLKENEKLQYREFLSNYRKYGVSQKWLDLLVIVEKKCRQDEYNRSGTKLWESAKSLIGVNSGPKHSFTPLTPQKALELLDKYGHCDSSVYNYKNQTTNLENKIPNWQDPNQPLPEEGPEFDNFQKVYGISHIPSIFCDPNKSTEGPDYYQQLEINTQNFHLNDRDQTKKTAGEELLKCIQNAKAAKEISQKFGECHETNPQKNEAAEKLAQNYSSGSNKVGSPFIMTENDTCYAYAGQSSIGDRKHKFFVFDKSPENPPKTLEVKEISADFLKGYNSLTTRWGKACLSESWRTKNGERVYQGDQRKDKTQGGVQ